jgi:hypothetical protein
MQHQIEVTFEDGNSLTTTINGTKEEIEGYYVGQRFELDETKPLVKCIGIRFL